MSADTSIGNGGRYTAAEFIARGYVIHSYLTQQTGNERILSDDDLLRFKEALAKTRIDVTTENLRDHLGSQVDARTVDDPSNPGQKMIQLNEAAWDNILKSDRGVYRLIFHEYLWVLGFDDTNYVISARVRFEPNVPSATPNVRTCGLSGSLYNRLVDCAKPTELGGFEELATRLIPAPTSDDPLDIYDLPQFFQWRLVARTVDKQQIWLDGTSGTLWTDADVSGQPYGHAGNPGALVLPYGASNECVNEGQHLKAGITGRFNVASARQWADSYMHGMLLVLPNLKDNIFWVRSSGPRISADAGAAFTADFYSLTPVDSDDRLSFRCTLEVVGIN